VETSTQRINHRLFQVHTTQYCIAMVRGRRLRRDYNTVPATVEDDEDDVVAAVEDFVDEEDEAAEAAVLAGGDVEAPIAIPHRRPHYQSLSTNADVSVEPNNNNLGSSKKEEEEAIGLVQEEEEDGKKVTVMILDPAQKRFPIEAYTHWTIAKFKEAGHKVHKVAPSSQRLIYRGQLLQDTKTLQEHGINDDRLIVHLFPKPRVIIAENKNNANSDNCTAASDDTDDDEASTGDSEGAHIPQIVLNPDEAEQRATILVLGSTEFLEAQNNVKLFSFLLLVISSIELFNLLLILMGVPPDTTANDGSYSSTTNDYGPDGEPLFPLGEFNDTLHDDDLAYHHHSDPTVYQEDAAIQQELQTWHFSNNFDLIISAFGVYVAILGIRATNETTHRLAQQYLVGTVIVGICWMIFNYWFTVHVDEEVDEIRREERHNRTHHGSTTGNHNATGNNSGTIIVDPDDDDIPYKSEWDYYQQNLSLMMIPGMVWVLCCVRAWQFQHLLAEAEQEAEERIRNELEQHEAEPDSSAAESQGEDQQQEDEEAPPASRSNRSQRTNNNDPELQLPSTNAVIA
jgi:hypothetical protein